MNGIIMKRKKISGTTKKTHHAILWMCTALVIGCCGISCFVEAADNTSNKTAEVKRFERRVTVSREGLLTEITEIEYGKLQSAATLLSLVINPSSEKMRIEKAYYVSYSGGKETRKDATAFYDKAFDASLKGLADGKIPQTAISLPKIESMQGAGFVIVYSRESNIADYGGNIWLYFSGEKELGTTPVSQTLVLNVPNDKRLYYEFSGFGSPSISKLKDSVKYAWKAGPAKDNKTVNYVHVSTAKKLADVKEFINRRFDDAALDVNSVIRSDVYEAKDKVPNRRFIVEYLARVIAGRVTYKPGFNTREVKPFRPDPARQVYESGFGDDGDISTVVTGMLRLADVEAYPALFSSADRTPRAKMLPDPTFFDHYAVYIPVQKDIPEAMWYDPATGLITNANKTDSPLYGVEFLVLSKAPFFTNLK